MQMKGRGHIREMTGMEYGVVFCWTTESGVGTASVQGRRSSEQCGSWLDEPVSLGDRGRLGAVDDS
jgi:hypothetical protein